MTLTPYVALDTEFLREKTYYPQLCLVQMAHPTGDAVLLDPIQGDSLSALESVLFDLNVVKVFHAGRQDLEIFVRLYGRVPAPLFDTQIAAMALGFGESVSYATLVSEICRHSIDKSQQFTDWSLRPLKPAQLSYAADDVLYLRRVYEHMVTELERQGRTGWFAEEMAPLLDKATYEQDPETAWERIKIRSDKPPVLAVLRALAAWREREAQRRNLPKGRIFKDDVLAEMALTQPQTPDDLARVRSFPKEQAHKDLGHTLIGLIKQALALPREQMPRLPRTTPFPQEYQPALEMLKMLLRIVCAEQMVSPKLVADSDELQQLVLKGAEANIPALAGWRREVFGEAALALLSGGLALSVKNGKIIKSTL